MNIEKIEIRNFKGFEHQIFEFESQFTILIGDNATGKTSVLEALAVALGSFFIGIDEVNTRNIRDNEIRIKNIDGQPKPQKPVFIETKGNVFDLPLIWKRELTHQKTKHKALKELRMLVYEKVEKSRQISGIEFPVIAYYSTARLWAEHEKVNYQTQKEGLELAYLNCLSAKSSSKEFLSWYKTQEDSVLKFAQPLDIAHLQAFKNTILSLLPNNNWQDMAFDRRENELMGIFTNEKGEKQKLKYSQLSDGYRNMIGLASDIAYRCIQLNPHFGIEAVAKTKGVVLIDEIDLHLHPNWQKNIVQNLKNTFPNIQFIATTHSPFIVQSLEKNELINLDIDIKPKDMHPKNLPINQVITDIMRVENLRSDNFEERVKKFTEKLQNIENQPPTMEDYAKISQELGDFLENEVNNPFDKAFLKTKNQQKT